MVKAVSVQEVLHKYFGYKQFRPHQADVVRAIVSGCDALAVMPTGAGKSICYQVPGIVMDGLALVISPLVSLMIDQVQALIQAGVRGAYLNSTLSYSQQSTVLYRAQQGAYDIMYVAPERLADPRFMDFLQQVSIPLVAIDEAHCVSQWGQDFRPSYLAIAELIELMPKRPVLAAFTATATARVRRDIIRLLKLHHAYEVVSGFDRPNLYFEVQHIQPKRKLAWVGAYALKHVRESGIIYCSTRKDTDKVHAHLVKEGVRAVRYHAGMTAFERAESQQAFIDDEAPVMVATNAFGMGIDKSNVRFVVHHNMPGSLEAYYQEAGRAGRDGEPAACTLLWSDGDVATCRYFIEQDSGNEELSEQEAEVIRASQRRLLEGMMGYCHTTECLRGYILNYFGEYLEAAKEQHAYAAGATCKNCSNCSGTVDAVEVTAVARAVMRCVQELAGRYGKSLVVDVLRGSKSAKILKLNLDQASSYHALDAPASQVKEVIELLVAKGCLVIAEGAYPTVDLGPRFRDVVKPDFKLSIKRVVQKGAEEGLPFSAREISSARVGTVAKDDHLALFERLRCVRKRLADEANVPPYLIFSDATLRDMCEKHPLCDAQFLQVSGVGATKLARYGEVFLAEIIAFSSS